MTLASNGIGRLRNAERPARIGAGGLRPLRRQSNANAPWHKAAWRTRNDRPDRGVIGLFGRRPQAKCQQGPDPLPTASGRPRQLALTMKGRADSVRPSRLPVLHDPDRPDADHSEGRNEAPASVSDMASEEAPCREGCVVVM